MATSAPGDEPRHSIQVVARRSGLTPDLIRAWERRYGVVAPRRTNGRRRLYSDSQTERLRLLRRATEGGRRIGDIARLDGRELLALVRSDGLDADTASFAAAESAPVARAPDADRHVRTCLAAIRRLDAAALDDALADAAVGLCVPSLLEAVVAPLMASVGEQWRSGRLRVAQEHLAAAQIRSFLGGLLLRRTSLVGPVLVLATPRGETHELGTLAAGIVAAGCGWQVVYLGADVPGEEIAYAARQRRARAVALGLARCGDDPRVQLELRRTRASLPADVGLLVGGGCVGRCREALLELGAVAVPALGELPDFLDRVGIG